MRILYIYGNASLSEGSIRSKITGQIHYLNAAGAQCRGAFFCKDVQQEQAFNEHINFVPFNASARHWFKRIHQQGLLLSAVEAYLDQHQHDFDLIYIRYPGAHSQLLRIMRRYGHKICLEHNAKEIWEALNQWNHFKPFWKPSSWLAFLGYVVIPVYQELAYGIRIRRKALMGTCVSDEMARYERRQALGSYHLYPISNSIDIAKNPLRTAPAFDGSRLNILFLKGTSGVAPWNGIDRLIRAMQAYQGPVDVHLYIAGTNSDGEFSIPDALANQIHISGYLDTQQLNQLFNSCHIGAATLALFRHKQEENAALKLRMYAARGMPFFYAYRDMDLKNQPEASAWSLQFPNNNSPIDLQQLVAFTAKALQPGHEQTMRNFAASCMGYDVRMKKLAQALSEQLNRKKTKTT